MIIVGLSAIMVETTEKRYFCHMVSSVMTETCQSCMVAPNETNLKNNFFEMPPYPPSIWPEVQCNESLAITEFSGGTVSLVESLQSETLSHMSLGC